MIGSGNGNRLPAKAGSQTEPQNENTWVSSGTEELRLRVQQRSLREQLERNHFLLQRFNAASARLIESLEHGDVCEAIAEIIANLIGSEEVAIFDFCRAEQTFSLAWAGGVQPEALEPFLAGAGMFGRAAHQGASQFQERQPAGILLPYERNLTAAITLK